MAKQKKDIVYRGKEATPIDGKQIKQFQKMVRDVGSRKHSMRGFTLIELLVSIAIIGILCAIVLASLQTARCKGEATKAGFESCEAWQNAGKPVSAGSKY